MFETDPQDLVAPDDDDETLEVVEEEPVTEKKGKKTAKTSTEKKPVTKVEIPKNLRIPLKDITFPDRYNRDKVGDIKGLVQSIITVGQKVALLVRVDPTDPSKVLLVDGRRRYAAMLEAGVKDALVTFTDDDNDVDAYLTSMLTNLAREGHNPIEIAESFQYLVDSGKKNKNIAASCSKSEAFVSQHLNILKLPPEAIKYARSEKLKFAHLRSLLRVFNEEDIKFYDKVFEATVDNDWTPEDTENAIVIYLDKKAEKAKAAGTKKDKKKAGRPTKNKPKLKDYANMSLKLVSQKEARAYFLEANELVESANTKDRVNFYKGIIIGMERLSGLRDTF
jgi:ParB/RepB/Spo0J family partition protein